MVLDKLSKSLKKTIDKISGSLFVDKKLINELVKDLQRALIESDVNIEQVLKISESIKSRVLSDNIPSQVNKKDYLIKVVYEELISLMGGEEKKLDLKKKTTIMLVGLFGSGKTTTTGKLSKYFSKRGKKVAVVQTDTYRPAAYDQLKQITKKEKVDFFGDNKLKDPVKIYKKFKKDLAKYDLVIVDTAGRDALSKDLIKEIEELNKVVKLIYKYFVVFNKTF